MSHFSNNVLKISKLPAAFRAVPNPFGIFLNPQYNVRETTFRQGPRQEAEAEGVLQEYIC